MKLHSPEEVRDMFPENRRPGHVYTIAELAKRWSCSDNTTGFKGVSLTKRGTYSANISINGRVKYLGAYPTPEEAHAVYLAKAKELRGQFVPQEGQNR